MPHARHVNLAFHEGAALPDPQGLLQGTGRMMRHVRIEADQQIHSAALTALI